MEKLASKFAEALVSLLYDAVCKYSYNFRGIIIKRKKLSLKPQ